MNKEIIGKVFWKNVYSRPGGMLYRSYEVKINQNGLVEYWQGDATGKKLRYWSTKVGIKRDNDINDSRDPVMKFRAVVHCDETRKRMLLEITFSDYYTKMTVSGTQEQEADYFIHQNQDFWFTETLTYSK